MGLGQVKVTNTVIPPIQPNASEGRVLFCDVVDGKAISQSITAENLALLKLSAATQKLIEATIAQAGNAFQGYYSAVVKDDTKTVEQLLRQAILQSDYKPELVIWCPEITTGAELNQLGQVATTAERQNEIFIVGGWAGALDKKAKTGEDWSAYKARLKKITQNINQPRVFIVPNIWHGTSELGLFVGQLQKIGGENIAYSPMRVLSGSVKVRGNLPKDINGAPLTLGLLEELDAAKLSVVQWYNGYEGYYFADLNLLGQGEGTVKTIEYRRCLDKAIRLVFRSAVKAIANPIANNKNTATILASVFSEPLELMVVNKEIQPIATDAVEVLFTSQNSLQIGITIVPYLSAKSISANISIDRRSA